MSMGLHMLPEVYQAAWIEMKPNVAMRYEVDHGNELATLYFGHREEYVLTLSRHNLNQLINLSHAARQDLATPAPTEDQ